MPRDGTGASDNVVELGHNIVHGAGEDTPAGSGVDRSSKAAPPPDHEPGEAIEGMGASGGGSAGEHIGNQGSGKGPIEAGGGSVNEETAKPEIKH